MRSCKLYCCHSSSLEEIQFSPLQKNFFSGLELIPGCILKRDTMEEGRVSLPFRLETEDFSVLRTLKVLLSDFCKLNFFLKEKNVNGTCLFKRKKGDEFELKM